MAVAQWPPLGVLAQSMAVANHSRFYQEILARLRSAGLNPDVASAGVDWLIKALHPAWDHDAGGVPDQSYVNSVHSNLTVQRTISKPAGVVGDWAFCLWSPPGDQTQVVILTGATDVDFTTAVSNTTAAGAGTVQVTTLYSQPYEGVGFDYVFVAGGAPPPLPVQTPLSVSRYGRWRYRYRGLTVYPVAAPLYEQGTIYAGQISNPVIHGAGRVTEGLNPIVLNPVPGITAFLECSTLVPLSEERLALFDPSSVAWPFKNGAYLPTRFTSPDMSFVDPPNSGFFFGGTGLAAGYVLGSIGQPVGCRVRPITYRNANGQYVPAPWSDDNVNQFTGYLFDAFDTSYDMVTQNVVIGRGIHENASITVRSYAGKECVPRFDSAEAQFSRSPARYEKAILDIYFLVAQDMGTVFPSSYNSFGTLLQSIAAAAARVLPMLGRAVRTGASALLDEAVGPPGRAAIMSIADPVARAAVRALTPRRSSSRASSKAARPMRKRKGRRAAK